MALVTLRAAHIRVYVNGKIYNPIISANFTVDYGEQTIYGIDSAYPQEIATTKITVSGTISCYRLRNSGGIQAVNLRPSYIDAVAASPYISLRINDRDSLEDIILIPNAKVTSETHTIVNKSTYKLTFSFVGQIPLFSADRVPSGGSGTPGLPSLPSLPSI
jgi:hypothetical protein